VAIDHIDPMWFPPLVIHWTHALIGLPKLSYLEELVLEDG
jgi:hypothetical protein